MTERLTLEDVARIAACLGDGTYTATERNDFGRLCALAQSALRETGRGGTTLIAELDALEAKATKGEWTFTSLPVLDDFDPSYELTTPERNEYMSDHRYYNRALGKDNAAFIAALRNAYPKLRALTLHSDPPAERKPGDLSESDGGGASAASAWPTSMYRKRPVVVEAHQWFKNGDHPEDYSKDHDGLRDGEPTVYTAAFREERAWEGDIVRYFRRPDVLGIRACQHCQRTMHEHGWIDTKEGGHVVCPGDWIITGIQGERYPCKPDIFAETYEPTAPTPPSRPADGEEG